MLAGGVQEFFMRRQCWVTHDDRTGRLWKKLSSRRLTNGIFEATSRFSLNPPLPASARLEHSDLDPSRRKLELWRRMWLQSRLEGAQLDRVRYLVLRRALNLNGEHLCEPLRSR